MKTSTQNDAQGADKNGWIGWLQIGAIIAVIVLALILTTLLSTGSDAPRQAAPERPATPVEIARPQPADHQIEITLTGTVTTPSDISLSPQVGGRVIEVSDAVRAGARFEADEVLFEIDPRDYQVALTRAQAGLADAQSALDQLNAEAEINREEWRREYPNREITPLAAREAREADAIADRHEEFIEDSKTDPMFLLSHASMYAFTRDIEKALPLFLEASDNATESHNPAGVWIDIGRTALQFGIIDFAREQAQKAVESEDANVMTWIAAAEIASFSGQFDVGLERIEHAMTMDRFDEQAMLMARAANATLTREKMDLGQELLRRAYETSDDPFERFTIARGISLAGASLGSQPMIEEGLSLIEGIVEAHPDLAVIQADLGDIYFQLGQWDIAETHIVQAAEKSAMNAPLAKRASELYEQMGRTQDAERWREESQRRADAP